MLKHVGKHNNRRVLIVFKELPEPQSHMALVVYTDTLPTPMHDMLIRVVESKAGQSANELADALHKNKFADGRNMLTALHKQGWLKKVQTKQVIVMANAKSQVRLDEINSIIRKLKTGGEGAKQLAELDANTGLYDPAKASNIIDVTQFSAQAQQESEILTNEVIAKQTLTQAEKMETEANKLLAEVERLKKEAYTLDSSLKPKRSRAKVKRKKIAA